MKNENKTRSSPQRCRQPGSSREGEQRGARASPRRGAGGMEGTEGNRGFGVAAPPPPGAPAHLVASFVDAGRGTLAQEVLGAPEVVWGALHLQQRRCGKGGKAHGSPPGGPLGSSSPTTEPRRLSVLAWQCTEKKSRPWDIVLGQQPPASYLASTERATPHEGPRMDGAVRLPKTTLSLGPVRAGSEALTDALKKKKKKNTSKQTAELQGGERHLPAPRTETYGIAKPALQASAAAGGGNASASCSRKKIPELQPSPGVLGSAAAPLAQRPGPGWTPVTANGAEHQPSRSPAWVGESGSEISSGSASRGCGSLP